MPQLTHSVLTEDRHVGAAGSSSDSTPHGAAVGALAEEISDLSIPVEGRSQQSRRSSAWSMTLAYAVTVFVLITLNFVLPRAMPGDPISALVTPGSAASLPSETLRAELESYYGLDQPVWTQYLTYLGDLVQGDLGLSIRYNAPVAELVQQRLPWTILLIGTAIAVATMVGSIAGVHSGWRRGRSVDRGLLGVFMGLRSFPVFFLASIALFVVAVQLDWVPLSGAQTRFGPSLSPLARVADIAHHLVLPALILATQFAGGHYLVMRAGMVGELGSDYLLAGRAKGLRERRLKYRYAARNALLPVVTVVALQLSQAVTGSILVETVFAYPGMGRLLFESISFRDYPTMQACFLVLTLLVVSINFLADLVYGRLDPRTKQ